MPTKVQVFKTGDNRTFEQELPATEHEFSLEARGLFQTKANSGTNKQAAFTAADVGAVIATHPEDFKKLIISFQKKINRLKKQTA